MDIDRDQDKIQEIKQVLLCDRTKFYHVEEIEDKLKKYNLNNTELFEIVKAMIKDAYIFRWLDYISLKIPVLSNHKEFLVLLKEVIVKVKGDMAQGNFIQSLISIGERSPEKGVQLYKKMKDSQDPDLIGYSCYPLGGSGKKSFFEVFNYIKEDFENSNSEIKVASIKTIRVITDKTKELQKADHIFNILYKASLEGAPLGARLQAIEAIFELSQFRYDFCVERLLDLAKNGNSEIRYVLAEKIWLKDLKKAEDELRILLTCAKDDNKNVLNRVAIALSRKGSILPESSLRIIKYWILNGKYFDVHEIDYSVGEIGKGNLKRSIKEVVSWISDKDEKKLLFFFIPIVLEKVSSSDYLTLFKSMEKWWEKNERCKKIAIETARRVLTEIYPADGQKITVVNTCFNLLVTIARKEGRNVDVLIQGEPEKLFQCMLIIDELRGVHKELNFKIIDKNLETHTVIRDFLGQKWFDSFKNEGTKYHPLLAILSSELDMSQLNETLQAFRAETNDSKKYLLSMKLQQMVTPEAYLNYIEDMIRIIILKSKKLKNLKDGLRNGSMFFDTISEIESISAFIHDYAVEIEPKLNGKKLDLKIELNPDIYVEVISPDMFKPLKYLDGKTLGIKNRVRGKILDELKHHFKDVNALGKNSWVIVVDLSQSEISVDFIEDALMGSEQFTFFLNKEKGEVVGQSISRINDSVNDINTSIDILSAVICYKTELGNDGKFHRQGKIVVNSQAKNPLSADVITKIENNFFS